MKNVGFIFAVLCWITACSEAAKGPSKPTDTTVNSGDGERPDEKVTAPTIITGGPSYPDLRACGIQCSIGDSDLVKIGENSNYRCSLEVKGGEFKCGSVMLETFVVKITSSAPSETKFVIEIQNKIESLDLSDATFFVIHTENEHEKKTKASINVGY